jgi:N utilization substance protein B
MTITAAREIAILLGFSAAASGDSAEDTLERFFEAEHYASLAEENPLFSEFPDEQQLSYIRSLVGLIAEHRGELDAYIEKYARGWKVGRIDRTAGAILRCAMSEILWLPEVPNAAAINEAVELAKKYEDTDVVSFINGILGSFVRGEVENKET